MSAHLCKCLMLGLGLGFLVMGQPRATGGITMNYELRKPAVVAHEPVLADVTINNNSSEPVELDLGANRESNFSVRVVTPDGRRIGPLSVFQEGLSEIGRVTIAPGKAHRETLILDKWFRFEKPGTYAVSLQLAGNTPELPDSPPVELTVQPRNEHALQQTYAQLAKTALSAGTYLEAELATESLSYARDSLAIPYLLQVLNGANLVTTIAVQGLVRIGTPEAVDALIRSLQAANSGDKRGQIVAGLRQLEQQIEQPDVRMRIRRVL